MLAAKLQMHLSPDTGPRWVLLPRLQQITSLAGQSPSLLGATGRAPGLREEAPGRSRALAEPCTALCPPPRLTSPGGERLRRPPAPAAGRRRRGRAAPCGWDPAAGAGRLRSAARGSAGLPRPLPLRRGGAHLGEPQTLRARGLCPGQACPGEAGQPGSRVPEAAGTCRRERPPGAGSGVPRPRGGCSASAATPQTPARGGEAAREGSGARWGGGAGRGVFFGFVGFFRFAFVGFLLLLCFFNVCIPFFFFFFGKGKNKSLSLHNTESCLNDMRGRDRVRARTRAGGGRAKLPAGGGTCCRGSGGAGPDCRCSCRWGCDSRTPGEAPSTAGPLRRKRRRVNPCGDRPYPRPGPAPQRGLQGPVLRPPGSSGSACARRHSGAAPDCRPAASALRDGAPPPAARSAPAGAAIT